MAAEGPDNFTFYDVFFWRDAPDWYRKTFHATGFGLAFCSLKQYLSRHELEVFLPPRSAVLPSSLRDGYRSSQMLKYGFLRVGKETHLLRGRLLPGEYRGQHSWENFAASGAAAGTGGAAWLLRPLRLRPVLFAAALGAAMGAASAGAVAALGAPYWEEGHDFEGYFLGTKINLKKQSQQQQQAQQ
ncbi:hypothetical protein GPECTOR_61g857 [Gonium pectorale]|uniref:Transmembrane protein n=1 Tax=Gonium pectorale TaxID=33097 RepID=A0A150G506_GONPE|nr:hypothetical protein GPECTOR_61g857 [Gonium pectorale]|eukprot:KXZ44904.1 hypothetical protein GPECTOR_61g857 [Gonium pectorale]